MRKIFFLCLCVSCLAVSLRPAAASAATTGTAVVNPQKFWSDVSDLEAMIQDILVPYTGHTLPNGLGGGSTLIVQNADNSAALGIYLAMLGAFYNYFMLYIAAPGFVALMLWFFYDYTRRLSKGDANAAMYFIHRALIILLTAILLFPAQEMVGVSDSRPTAVWLVTEGTEAGMELAGLTIKTGYDAIKGIVPAPVPSTPNPSILAYAGNYGFGIENAGNETQQASDTALLTNEINAIQAACGANDMCYFLSLPYTLQGFIQQDMSNFQEMQKEVNAKLKGNSQLDANAMHFEKAQNSANKSSSWCITALTGILTVIATASGVGAVATIPLGLATLAFAGSNILQKYIPDIAHFFGDIFFFLAFGCSFFFAVLSIMFKTLMYSVLGVMQAFMLPFGKWGTQKIVAYLSNIIAFLLTPTVLAFIWFIGLIARELYLVVMQLIPDYILAAGPNGGVNIFFYLITCMAVAAAFILPLCLALTRTSNYLSHIIGNVFQSGLSADARFRTLMAK